MELKSSTAGDCACLQAAHRLAYVALEQLAKAMPDNVRLLIVVLPHASGLVLNELVIASNMSPIMMSVVGTSIDDAVKEMPPEAVAELERASMVRDHNETASIPVHPFPHATSSTTH